VADDSVIIASDGQLWHHRLIPHVTASDSNSVGLSNDTCVLNREIILIDSILNFVFATIYMKSCKIVLQFCVLQHYKVVCGTHIS